MMDQALAERQRMRDWLLPHMKDGKPKAFTKDQYRLLAIAELRPVSKAAFNHAWISTIEDSGRQDWYAPKPGGQKRGSEAIRRFCRRPSEGT
jgi:hypothetical protein